MESFIKQLSKQEAIDFFNSGVWENWDSEQIVKFQLFQDLVCIDFSVYHAALEDILNRSVYTHEFAHAENLRKEYLGIRSSPTMQEIIDLLPKDKGLIFISGEE